MQGKSERFIIIYVHARWHLYGYDLIIYGIHTYYIIILVMWYLCCGDMVIMLQRYGTYIIFTCMVLKIGKKVRKETNDPFVFIEKYLL